jgi:hypothetical protein
MNRIYNRLPDLITPCYLLGVFLTWAYIVAYITTYHEDAIASALLAGWIPALFWPLIWTVEVMLWLFF